jgi:hypothetical protein
LGGSLAGSELSQDSHLLPRGSGNNRSNLGIYVYVYLYTHMYLQICQLIDTLVCVVCIYILMISMYLCSYDISYIDHPRVCALGSTMYNNPYRSPSVHYHMHIQLFLIQHSYTIFTVSNSVYCHMHIQLYLIQYSYTILIVSNSRFTRPPSPGTRKAVGGLYPNTTNVRASTPTRGWRF